MAETIGLLVLSAAGITEIGGFAVTASTYAIVGNIALAAATVGASYALQQKPEVTPQDGQLTVRQARAARRRNYGTVKVGGALMFSETKAGRRYQVLALSHGEIDSFFEHWLADSAVTVDGTHAVTSAYLTPSGIPSVAIHAATGTDGDAAFAPLLVAFPSYWTAAHQGKGIAKVLTITQQPASKDFTKVYPGGQPPVYRAVIQAVRVWDPRDGAQDKDDPSTWTFTENAVLHVLDYHRHKDGMGLAPFDDIFFTADAIAQDWIPAVNICDEHVPRADGSFENRYRCAGGYDLPAAPKDVLAAMLATCDGQTYQRGDGAIGIRVGKTVAPTVTIADEHILSYANFVRGAGDSITPVNVVTAKFTARNLDFQEADADPWRDEDSISATGREEGRNIDLTWVFQHNQARRLMKIAAHRLTPEWSGQIVTDLDGLRAYGERFIRLDIDELGIAGETFEVTSFEIMPASMTMVIGVRSFDQSAYDFDPETEEGTAPAVADTSGSGDTLAAPTGLAATASGGVINVVWDSSERGDTTAELQYRVHGATDWIDGYVDTGSTGHTPSLGAGHYDVQVQFVVGTQESGWTALLDIEVT